MKKIFSVVTVLLMLLVVSSASAHADLKRSDPAENAVLDQAPPRVTIEFTEAIEPRLSKIEVLFEDGATVDGDDTTRDPNNPAVLSVSLNSSRAGTYLVSWRALSEIDGHVTAGSYVFSVGKPIAASRATTQGSGAVSSPLDTALSAIARALTFIGQAVIAGVVAFRWLVWRPALKAAQLADGVDERSRPWTRRVLIAALALAGIGAALLLIQQSSVSGGTLGEWLGTRMGRIWLGRVATLIAIGVLLDDIAATARGSRFGTIVSIWLPAQLLFLTTMASHSAAITDPPVIPFIVDFVHLLATSIWVGGLTMLAFVTPCVARTLDDEDRAWLWLRTVVNFSTTGAVCVGILILTGSYLAFLGVGSWPALIGTAYGRALLLKLLLAGLAMAIGGYNLLVIKPRLDQAIDQPEAGPKLQRRFRRTVLIEAVLGLSVLAAAGLLTSLPRAKDPQPIVAAGPLQLATRSEDLDAVLTIDPARSGTSTYTVRLSKDGQSVSDASDVSLRFTYLTRGLGTVPAKAVATSDGAYAASGNYLSLPGEWQISTAVRRPNAFDVFADYRVRVKLDGQIEAIGQEGPLDALTKWLSIYGLVFGGAIAIVFGLMWLLISWKAALGVPWFLGLSVLMVIAISLGAWSILTFTREATPGLTLTNPFLPDENSLQIGKQLFEQNCAACHGPAGRGNGPGAAKLPYSPPDFGGGHLDIHTDGDVFYWIQNGPLPNSPMPPFKDKLTNDQIWHLVNYVRRLRNEATGPAPQVTAAPAVVLQPYTPPSFVAPEVPTSITPTPSASGDPAALKLLAQADAAMNTLTSLVEDQTVRDTAGNQLKVRFEFNAPDRMRYAVENGASAIQIESDDYQQKPDRSWLKNQRGLPFVWPQYTYALVADNAQLDTEGDLKVVLFTWNGFDFKLWIDPQSGRITRYLLTDGTRTVDGTYSAFDAAAKIDAPLK